eukprot:CAMPEP_0204586020 /NCGR_PEP_ID=MMETSP0661-20131031/47253_1 /ASSEMBLY_ACC=CAM_ASM_000606 /TAXON_ID=109239 /ORGANISM="Alexandrium margalefi, Strain AMGDE01CS-322" /LENGTH=32 /DNA_ID= /DNA_START= /DNA_END= /DNA_ORIENTATION=
MNLLPRSGAGEAAGARANASSHRPLGDQQHLA